MHIMAYAMPSQITEVSSGFSQCWSYYSRHVRLTQGGEKSVVGSTNLLLEGRTVNDV